MDGYADHGVLQDIPEFRPGQTFSIVRPLQRPPRLKPWANLCDAAERLARLPELIRRAERGGELFR